MPYCTTQAIVLRRSDYREHDRVLTLLTPARGRVDVSARGCRRPKSPLLAASELFSMGEYVLFQGKGHEMVTSCELQDSFYPLRQDVDKLAHACLMLVAADSAAQPEEPAGSLYILLARSLARLAYGSLDAAAVSAAFLVHFIGLLGYRPQLDACVHCGKARPANAAGYLDAAAGGIACTACRGSLGPGMRLEGEALCWIAQVQSQGIDRTPPLAQPPLAALVRYTEHYLDRKLPQVPPAP